MRQVSISANKRPAEWDDISSWRPLREHAGTDGHLQVIQHFVIVKAIGRHAIAAAGEAARGRFPAMQERPIRHLSLDLLTLAPEENVC